MPPLWNPTHLLSLTGTARPGELQCSATNTSDARPGRCGWQKWSADPDNRAVQALLPSLAATPPDAVTSAQLLHLAELCLCRDKPAHAGQKAALAARWQDILRKHVEGKKRPRTPPDRAVLAQAAYPSPESESGTGRAESEVSFGDDGAALGEDEVGFAEKRVENREELRVAVVEEMVPRKDLFFAKEIAEQLLGTVRELQKDVGESRERAVEAEEEATRLRGGRDDARERLAEVEQEKHRLVGVVEAAQGAVGEMRMAMEQLEKRVALLESDKEIFRLHLQEMDVELAAEKTRVLKLLNRLAVDEKRDVGRELVPVRKMVEDGWKTRVRLWLRKLGGGHGRRPNVSKYDV